MNTPQDIIAGIGFNSHASADDIVRAVESALAAMGGKDQKLAGIATLSRKAGDELFHQAAARLSVPVIAVDPPANAATKTQSPASLAATGLTSVAEATAMAAGDGRLVLPRQVHGPVTIALSRAARERRYA